MESLNNKIKSLLSDPKELDKKQVALFLTQNKIDKLDTIVKKLTAYSTRRITRNDLIELAVDNLIESAPIALKEYLNENYHKDEDFDTIICPSTADGIETIINEGKWYYVRINESRIKHIKFIAWYFGSPISAITMYAKVKTIEKGSDGKSTIYLDGKPIELQNPVILGNMNAMGVRSNKFIKLDTLLKAKEYSDL